jgi:hypothetical protein
MTDIKDMTSEWKYEIIKNFTSPGHAHIHTIRRMDLDHEKIGELFKFIKPLLSQAYTQGKEDGIKEAMKHGTDIK